MQLHHYQDTVLSNYLYIIPLLSSLWGSFKKAISGDPDQARIGGGIKAVESLRQKQVRNTSLINMLPDDGGLYNQPAKVIRPQSPHSPAAEGYVRYPKSQSDKQVI